MSERPKKSKGMCAGCRDNFYNGFNDLGVRQCWNFTGARVVSVRFVPMDMRPPWDGLPTQYALSCHKKNGYASMKAKRKRERKRPPARRDLCDIF